MVCVEIGSPRGERVSDTGDRLTSAPSTHIRVRVRRRLRVSARSRLLLGWLLLVLTPWVLQGRSFVQLALPHRIPAHLVMASLGGSGEEQVHGLERRCPLQGLSISGIWWNVMPTHYVSRKTRNASASSADVSGSDDGDNEARICHFIIEQYNTHGAYRIGASVRDNSGQSNLEAFSGSSVFGSSVAVPDECRNSSVQLPVSSYYFYHGSIGFYSFFEYGDGLFCAADATVYVPVPHTMGSFDLNGNSLTHDNWSGTMSSTSTVGSSRWSLWYVTTGFVLLSYRTLVVHRSFLLCSHFGARCERSHEKLPLRSAFVFANESSRLVAHGASNKQRVCLLYFLMEGLMCDLFMLVSKGGNYARVQYISLGYNLASIVSLLFEMLETTNWVGKRTRCLARRLFFNAETSLMGELLGAAVLNYYVTALNRSPSTRLSTNSSRMASFYISSLCGHGLVVLGLVACILVVRAVGALLIALFSLGSIRALAAPNCVDDALRGRVKHTMLRGYKWRYSNHRHLVYTREALKSFGLLQMMGYQLDNGGSRTWMPGSWVSPRGEGPSDMGGSRARDAANTTLFLVQYHAAWVASRHHARLETIGRITGDHVEPCSILECVGGATFCDRMLGACMSDVNNEILHGQNA